MKLYDEQFRDHKQELTNIDVKLFSLDIAETPCSIVQLFCPTAHTPSRVVTPTDGATRLEVPMFDGNMLHWRNFWEPFSISVHSRSSLSPAEKRPAEKRPEHDWRSLVWWSSSLPQDKVRPSSPDTPGPRENYFGCSSHQRRIGKGVAWYCDTVIQHLRALIYVHWNLWGTINQAHSLPQH